MDLNTNLQLPAKVSHVLVLQGCFAADSTRSSTGKGAGRSVHTTPLKPLRVDQACRMVDWQSRRDKPASSSSLLVLVQANMDLMVMTTKT